MPKISELPAATNAGTVDYAPIVQSGTTKYGTFAKIRAIPRIASTGETISTAAIGCRYSTTGNMTIPASTFGTDDAVTIYNNTAGNITITQGSGLTLRLAGTATTGSRTLAQRGWATVVFESATEAVISGPGLT